MHEIEEKDLIQNRRVSDLTLIDKILIDYYKEASELGRRKEFLAIVTNPQRDRINQIINFLNSGTPLEIKTVPVLLSDEQKQKVRKLYGCG